MSLIKYAHVEYRTRAKGYPKSKHKEHCQCCGSVDLRWVYLNGTIAYCSTCLRSVGVRATCEPCTQAEYVKAWDILAWGEPLDRTAH